MREYWNKRFLSESRIWGDSPSRTAEYAKELFLRNEVKSILVPGAGYGRNAKLFASSGLSVTGIEISDEALKLARDHASTIVYYQGSVLDMPFSDDRYDAIYCFNVLHLFREAERRLFLGKCYDQLNEDGLAFFTVFSEQESSYGKGCEVEPNTFESKPGRPVHYFTEDDLLVHFKDFEVVETGIVEDPEDHGDDGPHTHLVRYIYARRK
jgi:SAM-dependent methyltransferase